ncbi:MAG: hypothetical protein HYU64_02210 [Armatimonadetes bacterium]|nr:hypothetical protein [Armatimonadota bacterium]
MSCITRIWKGGKRLRRDTTVETRQLTPLSGIRPDQGVFSAPIEKDPSTPSDIRKDTAILSGKDEEAAPPRKAWTVLAYLNGNNEMGRLAPYALRQLEIAGSGDNLNVVAQVSRSKSFLDRITKDWSGARRTLQEELVSWILPVVPCTNNITSQQLEDMGKVDMGDPGTLSDFLKWGIKNYPAEHYAVILYGPGGGFAGSLSDGDSKNVIDNKELAQVLKEASQEAGKKIDVVAFDSHMMAQAEVADQIKDSAKYMVAPEGTIGLSALPIDMVIKDLKYEIDDKPVTPEDLARYFVMEAYYQPKPLAELTAPAVSAVDLERLDGLKAAFSDLATSLTAEVKGDSKLAKAVREDIKATQNVGQGSEPYTDFRDPYHFAEILIADPRFSEEVKTKAKALQDAVKTAVIQETHIGKTVKNAHGLSAYMPTDYGYDLPTGWGVPKNFDPTHGYKDGSFAQATEWDELLKTISKEWGPYAALRKVGGTGLVNVVDKTGKTAKKAGKFALGVGEWSGYNQSWNAARQQPASGFMGIPPTQAVQLGVAGSAYSTFKAARNMIDAVQDEELLNKSQKVIDGVFDTTRAAAITGACLGLSTAALSGIAMPAGVASFVVLLGKMAYDTYAGFKGQVRERETQVSLSLEEKKARVESAPRGYHYINPLVRFLAGSASGGPMDPKLAQ